MRILLLTRNPETVGGGSRNVSNLLAAWRSLGCRVEPIAYRGRIGEMIWRACTRASRFDLVCAIDMNPLGFAGFLATRFARAKGILDTLRNLQAISRP